LRNTTNLKGKKWKLVNRFLFKGNVYTTQNEVARLLSEEVRKHIEKKVDVNVPLNVPPKILEKIKNLKKLSFKKIGKSEFTEFPKTLVYAAFPPCINNLNQLIVSGRHLSHIGRFTLTSFLINIGMSSNNVIDLFKNFSDFNDRLTSYQVQHIAGDKGSRTRYLPPKCETLKTHGICLNPDKLCQSIRHPLSYYKKKSVLLKRTSIDKTKS
jgi:DNA primase large subunit